VKLGEGDIYSISRIPRGGVLGQGVGLSSWWSIGLSYGLMYNIHGIYSALHATKTAQQITGKIRGLSLKVINILCSVFTVVYALKRGIVL